MSLKVLIQAAFKQCDNRTIQHTIKDKTSLPPSILTTNSAHIQKELIDAIHEYCRLSQLHLNVKALIDECLEQPGLIQIELLEHFQEQIITWRVIQANIQVHKESKT